jgi:site-specific recombinase XerC
LVLGPNPSAPTTIQKYYRALSALNNYLISEGILEVNALSRIKVPRAERKVVKSLGYNEVNQILGALGSSFDGVGTRTLS